MVQYTSQAQRAGKMVNNLEGDLAYRSFRPAPLPPNPALTVDEDMANKLAAASAALARLDAVAELIPSIDLFISMYVRKEALLSSQIEGTQCTLEDILNPQVDTHANLDVSDVVNYVKACSYALNRMHSLPLCCRLLKETHAELMSGVRGQEKEPGEFRRTQNWIGPSGCTLREARYIPPNKEDMDEAMSSLERFINEEDRCNPLIKAALVHYQFETIHPFLDGNGRIGRLLILLCLIDAHCLSKPVLYVSYFLKKNQLEYYDRMSEVRKSGNYEQWVSFFLEALCAAATDSLKMAEELAAIHNRSLAFFPPSNRRLDNARRVLGYAEQHPILTIGDAASELSLSYNTVATAVEKLVDCGVLRETTNASRNRVYVYEDYLTILRRGV